MTAPQTFSHWPTWPLPILRETHIAGPQPCPYLPHRLSTIRFFEAPPRHGTPGHRGLPAAEFQRLLDAGFRRSGTLLYQPMCGGCRQCIPIRIPTGTFTPSRSQRRILRRNTDLRITIAPPHPTAEKWELYQRYQRDWHDGKQAGDISSFLSFLYTSPVDTAEFTYRDSHGKLLGVGLCDLCPAALSSVYFYFDPDHARRSLGTFSALYELAWARDHHLPHWYAGYWVADCSLMSYKSRFQPAEILCTDGQWRPMPETPTAP